MSEKAVERRLRQVDQLHDLSLTLLKAGRAIMKKWMLKEGTQASIKSIQEVFSMKFT